MSVWLLAHSLRPMARCFHWADSVDLVTARSLHERSLALSREIGDRWGIAWALDNLAVDLLNLREAGPH
jgi:hypothetical protein